MRPVRLFAHHRLSGAILLVVCAFVALLWANSPWADVYTGLLETKLTVGYGSVELSKPLLLWINDGLMGIFFFVVGLEIKRELLVGRLATFRRAVLPFAAAMGGMIAPALLYTALNWGGVGSGGWGIPMATDIAFSLGVLALLGSRAPLGLRVFLTALAIVDDLGAILVIALFYSTSISPTALILAVSVIGLSALMNRLGMRSSVAYFLLGTLAWLAFLKSGVHATIAAVLMAFTIPARTRIPRRAFLERLETLIGEVRASSEGVGDNRSMLTDEEQDEVHSIRQALTDATAPLQRLEHTLLPVVTFLALPAFALANAGIVVEPDFWRNLTHPIALGIFVGLFFGKQIGVFGAAWLATRFGLADLPEGVTFRHVYGAALLAGVGFTMSLFINSLAFVDPDLQNIAKSAIMATSTIAAAAGYFVLRSAPPPPRI